MGCTWKVGICKGGGVLFAGCELGSGAFFVAHLTIPISGTRLHWPFLPISKPWLYTANTSAIISYSEVAFLTNT
jgi:hypothetical protein